MFRIFSSRADWLIGVGVLVAIIAYRTPAARAQDANTASVAELQQRVQELEAVVRQMKDTRDPNAAITQPVSLASGDPSVPAVAQAVPPVNAPAYPPAQAAANAQPRPQEIPLATISSVGTTASSCSRRIGRAICASQDRSRPIFVDSLIPLIRPRPPIRPWRAARPRAVRMTFLIRRARLGIEATMANYYEFRLLPDFAGTTVSKSITDAYVNVHYWDEFQFEVGKFKQPFSYEQLIQDRYVPMMERSMMDQLVPQRDEGVMIHGQRLFCGRFDYAVAVSNGDSNDSTIDNNNHKDFNGRLVFRPFFDQDRMDCCADCRSESRAAWASRTSRSTLPRRPLPR